MRAVHSTTESLVRGGARCRKFGVSLVGIHGVHLRETGDTDIGGTGYRY